MSDIAQKADSIAFHFYTKLFYVVNHARATAEPTTPPKTDKWFNLETPDTDLFTREQKEPYKALLSSGSPITSRPPRSLPPPINAPPFELQVLLTIPELTHNQVLVVQDLDVPGGQRRRIEPTPRHILLETWTLQFSRDASSVAQQPSAGGGEEIALPTIYKHGIPLFRSVFTLLRIMPSWKLHRRLRRNRNGAQFSIQVRVAPPSPPSTSSPGSSSSSLSSPSSSTYTRRQQQQPRASTSSDILSFSTATATSSTSPSLPTNTHQFPPIPLTSGSLSLSTTYLTSPNFYLDDLESLLSSRFLSDDDDDNAGRGNFVPTLRAKRGERAAAQDATAPGSILTRSLPRPAPPRSPHTANVLSSSPHGRRLSTSPHRPSPLSTSPPRTGDLADRFIIPRRATSAIGGSGVVGGSTLGVGSVEAQRLSPRRVNIDLPSVGAQRLSPRRTNVNLPNVGAHRLSPRRANIDLPSVEARLSPRRANVDLPSVPLPLPISRHVSIPSSSSGSPSSISRLHALQQQSAQASSSSSLASGGGASAAINARPPFPRVRTTSIPSLASSSMVPSPSITGFPAYASPIDPSPQTLPSSASSQAPSTAGSPLPIRRPPITPINAFKSSMLSSSPSSAAGIPLASAAPGLPSSLSGTPRSLPKGSPLASGFAGGVGVMTADRDRRTSLASEAGSDRMGGAGVAIGGGGDSASQSYTGSGVGIPYPGSNSPGHAAAGSSAGSTNSGLSGQVQAGRGRKRYSSSFGHRFNTSGGGSSSASVNVAVSANGVGGSPKGEGSGGGSPAGGSEVAEGSGTANRSAGSSQSMGGAINPSTLMTDDEAEISSFVQDIERRKPLRAGSPVARPGLVGLPSGLSRDRSLSRESHGSPLPGPPLGPPRSSPLSARVPLPSAFDDEAEIAGPSVLLQRRLSGKERKPVQADDDSTIGRSGGTELLRTEGAVDEKLREMREAFEASLKGLGSGSGSRASTVRASNATSVQRGDQHRRQLSSTSSSSATSTSTTSGPGTTVEGVTSSPGSSPTVSTPSTITARTVRRLSAGQFGLLGGDPARIPGVTGGSAGSQLRGSPLAASGYPPTVGSGSSSAVVGGSGGSSQISQQGSEEVIGKMELSRQGRDGYGSGSRR